MRNSWNFSTAILEIWVLVLTKPGWANETPTTSLKDTGEYNSHHNLQQHHHHPHQYQHHPSHHNHHYSLAGSISRDFFSSNRNPHQHQHHQPHSSSSFYSNSGSFGGSGSSTGNNNRHYSHHHNHHQHQQHHLGSQSALASSSYSPHRCYVCLPPNKNSREAQQILDIFAKELRPLIPDCSAFDPYVDAGRFEFDCPPRYGGCILRIHGTNISRACSKYRVNDCKKANSVEFCYCTTPLCNDKKPEPAIIPAVVHMSSRNAGGGESNSMRRGSSNDGTSKSSLRGRGADGGGGDEVVGNSQGIRARVDDEEVLGPDRTNVVDDDEDNGGSGTGSPDQHNSFIDPYTSTLDPTIFQEKGLGVDLEDPNPHTKIGIPITASTSSSSSSASSLIMGGRSLWSSSRTSSTGTPIVSQGLWSCVVGSWGRSSNIRGCTNIIHLFLHLHRVLLLRLFTEQVVDEEHQLQLSPPHNSDSITGTSIDVTHYLFGSQPRRHQHHDHDEKEEDDIRDELDEMRVVVDGEPPEAATTTFPLLPLFFNSQLCFIISFLVVVKVLSS